MNQGQSQRLPAIDGLRGLAVLAVLLFHAESLSGGPLRVPGGFLGVSVFFTISGFVVARMVLSEHEATNSVDLTRFAARRISRLAPAAFITIFIVLVISPTSVATWQAHTGFTASDALSSLWNLVNWHLSVLGLTAGFRLVHPLTHFWSLAVEAQLYLALALAVWAFRGPRLRQRLMLLAGWAWVASSAMALVVHGSVRREEFGTDIRLAEFAAGVLLATLLPHVRTLLARHIVLADVSGAIAAALFVTVVLFVTRTEFWLSNGGYALLGLVWVVWLCSALAEGRMTSSLAWAPLVHVGSISYSLYLVHWPIVLMLTDSRLHTSGWASVAIRCGVSLLVAEGVHRCVEGPARVRLAQVSTPLTAGLWLAGVAALSACALVLL